MRGGLPRLGIELVQVGKRLPGLAAQPSGGHRLANGPRLTGGLDHGPDRPADGTRYVRDPLEVAGDPARSRFQFGRFRRRRLVGHCRLLARLGHVRRRLLFRPSQRLTPDRLDVRCRVRLAGGASPFIHPSEPTIRRPRRQMPLPRHQDSRTRRDAWGDMRSHGHGRPSKSVA